MCPGPLAVWHEPGTIEQLLDIRSHDAILMEELFNGHRLWEMQRAVHQSEIPYIALGLAAHGPQPGHTQEHALGETGVEAASLS
jgi:hypothetical protein